MSLCLPTPYFYFVKGQSFTLTRGNVLISCTYKKHYNSTVTTYQCGKLWGRCGACCGYHCRGHGRGPGRRPVFGCHGRFIDLYLCMTSCHNVERFHYNVRLFNLPIIELRVASFTFTLPCLASGRVTTQKVTQICFFLFRVEGQRTNFTIFMGTLTVNSNGVPGCGVYRVGGLQWVSWGHCVW